MESPFPNRPQRFVPRGVAARQIDHVTVATADPGSDAAWYRDTLGHRFMEYTVIPDRPDWVVFAMTTVCERAHDMGLVWDPSPVRGRINHLAYWVDSREELLRAADVLLNQDVAIEFGPGKHGMGEQDYLYFREPGGVRIELNAGGYRNYEPDFETVRFEPQQGSNVFYKNALAAALDVRVVPARRLRTARGGGGEGSDGAVQLMRVLVVGGGIGGLSAAIALRQRGDRRRRRRDQPELGRLRRRDHPAGQRDPRARRARARRAGGRAGLRDEGLALPHGGQGTCSARSRRSTCSARSTRR